MRKSCENCREWHRHEPCSALGVCFEFGYRKNEDDGAACEEWKPNQEMRLRAIERDLLVLAHATRVSMAHAAVIPDVRDAVMKMITELNDIIERRKP